jgi:hypothetical protein
MGRSSDVRFGSKADIALGSRRVRFTPKSDIRTGPRYALAIFTAIRRASSRFSQLMPVPP